MATVRPKKKAIVDTHYCVACGVCMKNCPLNAISIPKGVHAEVDFNRCVGCGKCEKVCPASTITIKILEEDTLHG